MTGLVLDLYLRIAWPEMNDKDVSRLRQDFEGHDLGLYGSVLLRLVSANGLSVGSLENLAG